MLRGLTTFCAIAALSFAATQAQAVTTILDFEFDAMGNPIVPGQVIDDEYLNWDVSVEADNYHRSYDLAIAFDTSNPTGGDWDLRTPGSGIGNDTALGTVLILSERSPNSGGSVNVPDDEGRRPAGYIQFNYLGLAQTGGEVTVIDVEGAEAGGSIELFASGSSISYTPIPGIGNNSVQTINLPELAFDSLRVNLYGSGAIGEVVTFRDEGQEIDRTAVPEPMSAALGSLALASVVLTATRRRRA